MPEQAKDIFLAAIQQPVSERDAWLDGACAHDAELRRRVNQLLGAHAAEDSFLQQPAVQTAEFVSDDRPERQVLGTLGDFRIVREVGRGGMGVVYEAEQISLKRRVALKVLPFAAVLDNRQLQRFRTEAMAAARVHHQHIVPVYQVGCDRATHFYAMQYIDGRNVAELIGET
ncbi:MAG: protein kinase, partial [Planctomycetaceae bacterium]